MSRRARVWAFIVSISVILGIIVSCIYIYQFIASHQLTSPTSSTSINTNASGGGGCFAGRNYQMPSTLSGNVYFRVEFYTQGNPEYESWLSPGTWNVASGVNGWVWEFPATCSTNDLQADANAAYNRRHNEGANTGGVLDPSDPRVNSAFTPSS